MHSLKKIFFSHETPGERMASSLDLLECIQPMSTDDSHSLAANFVPERPIKPHRSPIRFDYFDAESGRIRIRCDKQWLQPFCYKLSATPSPIPPKKFHYADCSH